MAWDFPTKAARGSGFGTGLPLKAWRAFRFRRTAASRISGVPSWRPHGSLRSSRGRAPQPSRSIRTHRNIRCEPKRCPAASPFSYRRPNCVAASKSSICAVFRPTRSKRPQVCRTATAGQAVALADMPRLDAIVCGSVAVTREGRRCGKGEGYSHLEFAILRELGHPPVPIATTMHHEFVAIRLVSRVSSGSRSG